MDIFNPHEVFHTEPKRVESESMDLEERNEEEEMRKRNMLQLGWFAHRCQEIINNEQALAMKLEQLVTINPQLAEQIERSTLEEKQTIILNEMLDSPQGSLEANWFRVHFPSDKNLPLGKEYRLVLQGFDPDKDPGSSYRELDRLFGNSITAH